MTLRAFEIAKSGAVTSMSELRFKLKGEGYSESEMAEHFSGKAIKHQLRALMSNTKEDVN